MISSATGVRLSYLAIQITGSIDEEYMPGQCHLIWIPLTFNCLILYPEDEGCRLLRSVRSTKLQGVKSQEMKILILTAMRPSDLTYTRDYIVSFDLSEENERWAAPWCPTRRYHSVTWVALHTSYGAFKQWMNSILILLDGHATYNENLDAIDLLMICFLPHRTHKL
jgi:hypothetical protein